MTLHPYSRNEQIVSFQGKTSWRTAPLPDNWPRLRSMVLERDGYRCQVIRHGGKPCPNKGTEVDHINGAEDHSLTNLQAICRLCHGRKTQSEAMAVREYRNKRKPEVHPFLR